MDSKPPGAPELGAKPAIKPTTKEDTTPATADDNLPQQMGVNVSKPGSGQVVREAADVAAVERQQKIDALRTKEDYLEQYDPPKKKRRFLRFIGWMLLIVLLTGGGAAAGWYFWLSKEPKTPAPAYHQPEKQEAASESAQPAEELETYNSMPFLMQFDHPKGWKVSEGTDNKITAVSPAIKLKSMSGSTQTGQIIFTVQHKQTSLPDFKEGNALAARESEKIDYKKPSQVQRASTYISFLDYGPAAGKSIDAVYVTGDNGYQKDQYIPQADIVKSDPLIAIAFRKCSDDKCSASLEAMPVPASAWDDAKFSEPLKKMLQSIVVQ